MRLAIMQPYFVPYLGYWQLLNHVDCFIVYDNIQYTKRGWINRNRILMNHQPKTISLPIKKDSDYLNIDERWLAENAHKEIQKVCNQIKSSYRQAGNYQEALPVVLDSLESGMQNLFEYLLFSLKSLGKYLEINTPIERSSSIAIDHGLSGENKVLAFCKEMGATTYVNAIGGMDLYQRQRFEDCGVTLKFLEMEAITYDQVKQPFVPNLSIIDVMMFNRRPEIIAMLDKFSLR